ncbi:hypothetical protein [Nocardioides pocheonensis]|uniref:Uncharacterized protein n=1 Tax=Nocardioides pocheonensis TaxID=661485 RepID=A0A3N0GKZ8_9ACTN|nr:hypothetical protein [Nocardioides pocheonensis]RNM13069.1 hypothetical protein EFL26_16725 [Nocardioides pocheonensis]
MRSETVAGSIATVVGALGALVLGVVTGRVASSYLDDQPWVGMLYLVGAILLVIVGLDLWSPARRRGMWSLGALACLGVTAVFLVSTAAGLPDGSESQPWWDAWVGVGLLALAVYVVAMTAWLASARAAASGARWHGQVAGLHR